MFKPDFAVKAGVILLFAALTFVHLLPLSLHPAKALNDPLDCLLNTWILSWTGNRAVSDPFRLFQANVFHPHPDTLSYSEHLFPQAVMALPVAWISGNPVLAYNFVFFLAFVLNGFAAFLLVRHLTRSAAAGIAGGIVFAFCSYQMQHVAHLQLINAWFIPLVFLYLHKYFERPVLKNAVLFSLFVTLQGLACIYYGLFLLSLLAVIFPLYLILHPPRDKGLFFLRLLPPAAVSALILFLFSLPYLRLFRTYRFQRELDAGADLSNFFAAGPANVVWGSATQMLGASERYLFPGLLALVLAALGLFVRRRAFSFTPVWLRIALLVITAGGAVVSALVLLTGGFNLSAGIAEMSSNNEAKPAFVALVGAGVLLAVSLIFFRVRNSGGEESERPVFLYLGLITAALFLSFGREFTFNGLSPFDTPGQGRLVSPFAWLYDFVPGFQGIREPVRYMVFIMLGLAVLAGFGTKALLSKVRSAGARAVLAGCLLLFLNAEYLAVPVRTTFIPVGPDIPPTYEWLRSIPGDYPVVEVPFFSAVSAEAIPMYFSLFHGKNIVNGYSGFIPPAAWYIRSVFLAFPSWPCFDILNALDVRAVIFRPRMWGETRTENALSRLRDQFSAHVRPVRVFRYETGRAGQEFKGLGEDHVFEIVRPGIPPDDEPEDRPLDSGEWTARSNTQAGKLNSLSDGDLTTVWSTIRPRQSGHYLEIELDRPQHVTRVFIRLENYHTFAVDMLVETSLDGKSWWPHEFAYSAGAFVLNLVHAPLEPVQILTLDGRGARFIRITQKGSHAHHPWSVAELEIRVGD